MRYKFLIPISLLLFSFSIHDISKFSPAVHAKDPHWDGHPLSDSEALELKQALQQPYAYLSRGGQAVAFLSADGRYVIKFFKQNKFDGKSQAKRHALRHKVFNSYTTAFDMLSSETGLLFIHLNPTDNLKRSLTLKDSTGAELIVELDTCDFVIQRRAMLPSEHLNALLARGDLQGAEQALAELVQLIDTIYNKGIRNRDPNIIKNYGFIDGAPVLIDAGRLTIDLKNKRYLKKLHRSLPRLRQWIDINYPLLKPACDEAIEKLLHKSETP